MTTPKIILGERQNQILTDDHTILDGTHNKQFPNSIMV